MPTDEELDSLEDAMIENASGPRRVQDDTGSVEQHSIPDQIAIDKHLSSKRANQRGSPLRYFKFVPPGSV